MTADELYQLLAWADNELNAALKRIRSLLLPQYRAGGCPGYYKLRASVQQWLNAPIFGSLGFQRADIAPKGTTATIIELRAMTCEIGDAPAIGLARTYFYATPARLRIGREPIRVFSLGAVDSWLAAHEGASPEETVAALLNDGGWLARDGDGGIIEGWIGMEESSQPVA